MWAEIKGRPWSIGQTSIILAVFDASLKMG